MTSDPILKGERRADSIPERSLCRGTERRSLLFPLLTRLFAGLIFLLPGLQYPALAADGRPDPPAALASEPRSALVVEVTPDERVRANIDNHSQADVLRAMAGKNLFDIKGNLPAGEPITLNFSGLSLSEALSKVLRGYNYVLLSQGPGRKPVLTVIGKVERAKPTEQRVAVSPAPIPAGPTPEAGRFYVPPSMAEQPPAARSPQAGPGAGRFARPGGAGLPSAASPVTQPSQPGSESSGRTPTFQGPGKSVPAPAGEASEDQAQQKKAQPQPGQASEDGFGREDNTGDGSSAKTLLDGLEQKVEQK